MTRSRTILALVVWIVIVTVSAFVVTDFRAPAPEPKSAPADEFSAGRAWEHLVEITRAPHPVASFEYAEVRDYVTQELIDFGYDVELQVTTVDDSATVTNVLARLEGRCDTDDAVLMNTHFDSVPTGPGAGDAGIATAALLETARALTENEPLCNDIIVFLNGAEESGLVGAEAFVQRHAWADDVEAVLNFDARGGTGPLLLGEWSQESPELVRTVAGEVSRFFSSSLLNEAQAQVRNHRTDMEVFKRLGVQGVNGVHIGDPVYYHTVGDTPANVSRATLQHNGAVALALARHFGNQNLDRPPKPADGVWVSLTSNLLVAYGSSFAWILAAVVLGLLIAMVVAAHRRGARWASLGHGLLAFVAATVAGVVVVSLLVGLVWLLHPGADEHLTGFLPNYNDVPGASLYWWGFVAAGAAAAAAVFGFARRRITTVELTVSGVGLVAILGVLTTVAAQPISFLFVIPALGALIGTLVWLVGFEATLDRLGPALAPVLGAVPALLVYMGMLRLFGAASLGISAYFIPFVVLLLFLLVPPLETLRNLHPRLAPSALGLVAVVLLAVGAFTIDMDPSTTRFGPVDHLASVSDFEPVVFEGGDESPWTVGVVETGKGRTCLQASVPDDPETGDIGWCPVVGDLRPTLDYQWGRTATNEGTNVPGARYGYVEARTEDDSAPILFGMVNADATTVRVTADGVDHDVLPTSHPGFEGAVWVVALPAGTSVVDEIVIVDSAGTITRVEPGFRIRGE